MTKNVLVCAVCLLIVYDTWILKCHFLCCVPDYAELWVLGETIRLPKTDIANGVSSLHR